MTADQFAAYAREQIVAADQILAGHGVSSCNTCSCGRTLPCSVAGACALQRAHYQAKLALVEPTQLLPLATS